MKGDIDDAVTLFFSQGDEVCKENEPVCEATASQADDKQFVVR